MTWDIAKKTVFRRDDLACVRCGKPATDAHHRIVRGMGGTSGPEIATGMANLVSLCRKCHDWAHRKPAEAYRLGFLVHSYDDPAKVSLLTLAGARIFLHDDGTITKEARDDLF